VPSTSLLLVLGLNGEAGNDEGESIGGWYSEPALSCEGSTFLALLLLCGLSAPAEGDWWEVLLLLLLVCWASAAAVRVEELILWLLPPWEDAVLVEAAGAVTAGMGTTGRFTCNTKERNKITFIIRRQKSR